MYIVPLDILGDCEAVIGQIKVCTWNVTEIKYSMLMFVLQCIPFERIYICNLGLQ